MARWRLPALHIDRRIARAIARHSATHIEKPMSALTWLADEKLLIAACSAYWLGSRRCSQPRRRQADHLLLTVGVTGLLPHLLKGVVAQERPDRVEIQGNRHGIPRSGKAFDAFPSGHAVHMGALAAALSRRAPRYRVLLWGTASMVALTRVALLAHWLSDVLVGAGVGIGTEGLLHALERHLRE